MQNPEPSLAFPVLIFVELPEKQPMPTESDKLLVQQIRNGNERAWKTLIRRFEGRLHAFVNRRLRDHGISEDVVQETFIGFLKSLPNFDDNFELQTYLFSIATHKMTDQHRKNTRNPLCNLADKHAVELEKQLSEDPSASSVARSEERLDLERQVLARCLAQMVRNWREKGDWSRLMVMELLWVAGWANQEVAGYLNLSEQQVANIRFAANKKIRELVMASGLSPDLFPELNRE